MSSAPVSPTVDIEAEESVVIAVLSDLMNLVDVTRVISEHDFNTPVYREIFKSAIECEQRGMGADPVTVGAALERAGFIPEALSHAWVTEFFQKVQAGPSLNFMAHAEVVRDRSLKRQAHRAANLIAKVAGSPEKTGEEAVEAAEAAVLSLGESKAGKDAPVVVTVREGVQSLLTKLSTPVAEEDEATRWGLPTGFTALDANIGGLKPGQFAVVAARPSVGKTTLVLQMLMSMSDADRSGRTVFFSHELTQEELVTRMLCIILNCSQRALLDGSLIAQNPDAVNNAIAYLSDLPIDIIAEHVPKTSAGVVSFMRRHARKHKKISAFSIDYLQMMRDHRPGRSRTDELSEMVYDLKELAKELECPFIGLSQLNRGSESRQDDRYVMSDLRESGGIEQVADHIWFLSRPGYNSQERDQFKASIQQRKHRNGSSNNDFELRWNPYSARYENPIQDYGTGLSSGDSYPDEF